MLRKEDKGAFTPGTIVVVSVTAGFAFTISSITTFEVEDPDAE